MTRDVKILVADDDAGHARLIEKNLHRAGLHYPIERFDNGQDARIFCLAEEINARPAGKMAMCFGWISECRRSMALKWLKLSKDDPELRKIL